MVLQLKDLTKDELLSPGHRLCAGCGPAVATSIPSLHVLLLLILRLLGRLDQALADLANIARSNGHYHVLWLSRLE